MANIDNLNFKVILEDDDFNSKIKNDIEAAERLNVRLSSLLDAKAKIPQFKVSIKTKEAEDSLEKLNEKFAKLEKADWAKIGQKLDVTHQVEQALIQLRQLEEEIEVIQEMRQEKGGDMGLALELKNAQEQADRLIASIAALREVEKAVNAPSQFQAHIRSLTEQSMEYKQLVEYMKAEEAAAAEVAKEKAKEEAVRQKNAKAIEKERAAMAKGEFKEYIQSLTAANPTLKQMATYYGKLEKETAKNANAAKGAAVHQKRLNDQFKVTSRLGREVKNALIGIFSVHEASKLVSSLVRVTGEFELQKTTLAAMLGDLNKAEQIITRIQGLAVESPFQFKELTTYAKQLSAFSVPAEELYETTKMLADVSAGLGVGMDRIVLAYGQVRSAAFLRGQEVRQFTEAGIPILDELAKQFTELEGRAVSTGEVFDKISARLVPFEMVAKVFKDMTSEGGKFYKMQEVQAETLRGKISNLKDAYEMMLNEIGSAHSDKMKGAVDGLRSLMQNWEKIGAIIKTLIVSFGAYKATLATIWVAEKAVTAARSLVYFVTLTERVKTATAAYRAFGVTLKSINSMKAGIAVGAILAITTAITTAVKKAKELKKELSSIASTEKTNGDKLINSLDDLKKRLDSVKKGSQDYREAISELNRKYGEYLPKVFTEADAYEQVRDAANEAAEAIRNKARATTYEQGTARIEQEYAGEIATLSSGIRDVLLSRLPDISEDAAISFIAKFNSALKDNKDNLKLEDLFGKVADEYFGYGTAEKFRAVFGGMGDADLKLYKKLKDYADVYSDYAKAMSDFELGLKVTGSDSQYDTEKEREALEHLGRWYDEAKEGIDAAVMSQGEYNDEIDKLNIAKLRRLVKIYTDLGRSEVAKDYQKQLDSLLRVPEGWRGKVQKVLKDMGLGKGTSFGLWAEDTTQSTSYVDEMVKRYKELAEEIKMVSPFDKEQTKRLKQNQQAIEAISKALGINIKELAASKSEKFESKEEKRIKRLVDALKTLQSQYEKLKALGASDESIKTLFEGLYPELIAENGKDFVTDLKYIERSKGLIEKLAKLNPADAKKLLVDIGEDKFSIIVKTLEKQEKAYKQTAKAAGDYFDTLRKWSAEDFAIEGEGITFDISKITSDLRGKTNEIRLRAQKAKELFNQIDLDSEDEIAKVKEVFVKEFGVDAWDEFWTAYYENGLDVIEDLANKQIEYEKKVAQEKINDLAQRYVKESYFTQGVEMSDLQDKTLFQVRRIKKQLQDLMAKEPLKIPIEIEDKLRLEGVDVENLKGVYLEEIFDALSDAGQPIDEATQSMLKLIQQIQQAGLSTENFGDIIKKVFEGDLQELTEKQAKMLSDMVNGYLNEMQSLFESIAGYAEKMGNDELQGAMNGIAQSMEILGGVADKLAEGDWIGAIISGVSSLTKAILDAASAQEELKNAIAETRNEMMLLASQKAIEEGVDSIFGTDDYQRFTNAYEEAVKAHKQALADMEKQNMLMWGGSKDNWGAGGIAGAAGAGAALGAVLGSIIPGLGTAIGAGIGALVGMVTGVVGNAATEANDYAKSLQEMADEIGANLFNEDTGAFDSETLKKIKETYTDLDSEYQEILDKLITNAQIYENAITEMSTYMTDMFGQCADDMADSFIESFKKSGQAALDYGAIVDDVATNIAKSIIKSTILQNVWDDNKSIEAAKLLASGDAAGALGLVDEAMKAAQDLAPHIQTLLETLKPYFEVETEPASDLGTGIQKSITEDTASLLASYINAIRADVSIGRFLWQSMDVSLRNIAFYMQSMPSLLDYQAQTAANTYNTAEYTRQILSDIQSVMTEENGPRAIRILS